MEGSVLPHLYVESCQRGSGGCTSLEGASKTPLGDLQIKVATWSARARSTSHHTTEHKATRKMCFPIHVAIHTTRAQHKNQTATPMTDKHLPVNCPPTSMTYPPSQKYQHEALRFPLRQPLSTTTLKCRSCRSWCLGEACLRQVFGSALCSWAPGSRACRRALTHFRFNHQVSGGLPCHHR